MARHLVVRQPARSGLYGAGQRRGYYHLFAERLAWGYFDHPPVTALLVWLGERLFGGELGVRFFFTLLQPLYLWVLWRLVRPAGAQRRDATLYVMICAATLMLQLYGFIAVPDGPLLFAAALCFCGASATSPNAAAEPGSGWVPQWP